MIAGIFATPVRAMFGVNLTSLSSFQDLSVMRRQPTIETVGYDLPSLHDCRRRACVMGDDWQGSSF